uniref:lipocalin family protein n=1 Tax=Flavobacterium sp. TaxID=239 RepID=UPI00404A8EE4
MKSIFKSLVVFTAALLLFGCKANTATKVDNKTETSLKGNWEIVSVTYPGSDVIKVNSFHIADSQCMVGSQWKFVSNNNTGTMNVQKSQCPSFASPITWFINKEGNFVMKILDTGGKAKTVKEGYILTVGSILENNFQLIDKINVGGKMTDVVYSFRRI